MSNEEPKISANRQKKIEIVTKLNEKIAKAKAIVFTNYQGLTHKQLEGLKKTIKPLNAEYVVAKNSLVLRALEENKIKVDDLKQFEGPTGTLLIYEDFVGPLKELAKLVKELGIPSVKFGVMEDKNLTGEQVMKLSTLPTRETLLTQIAVGLKSPISGLHRALNWNLQKFVMTLSAVVAAKPALATAAPAAPSEPVAQEPVVQTTEQEPETILAETPEEKKAEEPVVETNESTEEAKVEEVKIEGGEN